jgi:hypothetical protein
MSTVELSVAPEGSVTVPAELTRLAADVVYMRKLETAPDDDLSDLPTIVQHTVRIELEKLAGSAPLIDVAPQSQIELRVLVGSGSVALVKTVPAGSQSIKIVLGATEVGVIAKSLPPNPTPVPVVVERRAYFVLVGEGRYPFEMSKLQVAPVSTAQGGWKDLGLAALFHSEVPATSSITWGETTWNPALVVWTATHLW